MNYKKDVIKIIKKSFKAIFIGIMFCIFIPFVMQKDYTLKIFIERLIYVLAVYIFIILFIPILKFLFNKN